MIQKHQQKYLALFETWRNGNSKDAAKLVRNLTKLQLVEMLIHMHVAITAVIGEQLVRHKFEDFVYSALSGVYE